ncbi:hypothetical protein CC2G_000327 [Coprinopsis cinerea AmutBmut pab1-1]|nr:hypothetical protein CC2G_000327 [Coprinopsis cinerea AmutBmut pab1-1]
MGRWTQYDEDDYRLPEGMKRIGYDSDTGRYFFRDADGSIWASAEGSEYGELSKVSGPPSSFVADNDEDNDDVEATPRTRPGGYQLLSGDPTQPMAYSRLSNSNSYRSLFPFFLIIAVILLLVWRVVLAPNILTGNKRCPEDTSLYYIQPGDSCWDVAKTHGIDFEKFKALNPKVNCDPLMPGTSVCLPPLKSSFSSFARGGKF